MSSAARAAMPRLTVAAGVRSPQRQRTAATRKMKNTRGLSMNSASMLTEVYVLSNSWSTGEREKLKVSAALMIASTNASAPTDRTIRLASDNDRARRGAQVRAAREAAERPITFAAIKQRKETKIRRLALIMSSSRTGYIQRPVTYCASGTTVRNRYE